MLTWGCNVQLLWFASILAEILAINLLHGWNKFLCWFFALLPVKSWAWCPWGCIDCCGREVNCTQRQHSTNKYHHCICFKDKIDFFVTFSPALYISRMHCLTPLSTNKISSCASNMKYFFITWLDFTYDQQNIIIAWFTNSIAELFSEYFNLHLYPGKVHWLLTRGWCSAHSLHPLSTAWLENQVLGWTWKFFTILY